MKQQDPTESHRINAELDARACEQSIWVGLRIAQRLGWTDITSSLTLCYANVVELRRGLEGSR